ncbi:SDR family NAD(P)-dependent oxidoreductase [Oceanicoccus sp. KOV_DT_Chl]|uniref:SDR family NAD(P)-dependent oxidoreductase n=1 Tax=Oceanicoccus sp. KOV_DT_Chl TaxID=1904639 RepID=UPI000C7C9E7D|nr:glucose 1-dehydrogenase [Oceanicoccus sp. KOV_DT_Chl]
MSLLANKIALVTGSGMGIGRAIAIAYAREGASVVVADFNSDAGQETVALIQAQNGNAIFVQSDVSKEEQVAATIKAAIDHYGRLDIACNSAAVSRGSGPIHEYDREVFDHTLEMCLTNTWLCMKYEIPAMLANGGGAIVNISSNASLKGQAFNTAYAAAKSGVNILTKSSAAEYGSQGIRINAVSPGVIRTPGIEKYFEEQPKIAEGLKRAAVMNRLGEPEEIAEAVVFLSSERASFITGQILSVDGGGSIK